MIVCPKIRIPPTTIMNILSVPVIELNLAAGFCCNPIEMVYTPATKVNISIKMRGNRPAMKPAISPSVPNSANVNH